MSGRAADFTGNIPSFYDQGLGPIFFAEFAMILPSESRPRLRRAY
jgi:hypothetical protein